MPDTLKHVTIDQVHPSPNNLRAEVGDVSELGRSIAGIGLQQPMRVRKNGDGYELIAGARRRAAILWAIDEGLLSDTDTWPIVIADKTGSSDEVQTAAMIVENLHRSGLTPIEEMHGYLRLANVHGWKLAEISIATGVPESTVKARLKWARLPDAQLERIAKGMLSITVANKLAARSAEDIAMLCGKNGDKVVQDYQFDELDRKKKNNKAEATARKLLEEAGHLVLSESDFEFFTKNPPADTVVPEPIVALLASVDEDRPLAYRSVDPNHLANYLLDVMPPAVFTLERPSYGGVVLRHRIAASRSHVDDDDEELTDAERDQQALITEYQEAFRQYQAARKQARIDFVRDAKPAEHIAFVLGHVIHQLSYRHSSASWAELLGIDGTITTMLADPSAKELARIAAAGILDTWNPEVPGCTLKMPERKGLDLSLYDDEGRRLTDDELAARPA